MLKVLFLHNDGTGAGRRQVRHLDRSLEVPLGVMSRKLACKATDDPGRFQGQRFEIEDDGHEEILRVAEEDVVGVEVGDEALVEEQRRRLILSQRQAQETRLVDEAFGQSVLQAHFVREEAVGVVAAPGALDEADVGVDFGDDLAALQECEGANLQLIDGGGWRG